MRMLEKLSQIAPVATRMFLENIMFRYGANAEEFEREHILDRLVEVKRYFGYPIDNEGLSSEVAAQKIKTIFTEYEKLIPLLSTYARNYDEFALHKSLMTELKPSFCNCLIEKLHYGSSLHESLISLPTMKRKRNSFLMMPTKTNNQIRDEFWAKWNNKAKIDCPF